MYKNQNNMLVRGYSGLLVFFFAISTTDSADLSPMAQIRYNEQLWRAAFYGRADAIQFWYDAGAQLESRGMAKTTPLIVAANNNRREAVSLLLDLGADINGKDQWRNTALFRALGYPSIVSLLLSRGANESDCDWKGDTVLMNAAAIGSTESALSLIDAGANVNAKNTRNEWTAVMYAASNGHTSTVQAMIDKGANLSATDSLEGKTALARAVENGHADVVRILLGAGMDPNQTDGQGMPMLVLAAKYRRFDVISLLLSRGANVDAVEAETGRTALMMAASKGANRSVDVLLKNGASVSQRDTTLRGWSALDYAVSEETSVPVIRALLNRGANVSETDARGRTALFHAAQFGSPAVLQELLNASSQVNVADKDGSTPLMSATLAGRIPNMLMLMDEGADVNATTTDGITSLMIASRKGYINAVQLLLDRGAEIDAVRSVDLFSALIVAVYYGKTEIVSELTYRGADATLQDSQNMTAIEIAAVKEYRCMVDMIAAVQPDVITTNATNSSIITQQTPCIRDYDY